jgi:quercetin dioxygenase-like cupin family protein
MATNGEIEFKGSPLYVPTLHITSHNAAGQAFIHSSEKAKATLYPEHRFASTNLYTTSAMPVALNDDIDIKQNQDLIASGNLGVVQPKGTVLRFADFAPNSKGFIHRTQSLDYGIVLEGTIVLELDDGSTTLMSRGDVAIQRATMHGWHNPSETEWARLLFVLQDCEPLRVNGKSLKEDLGEAHGIVPNSGND